MIYIQQNTKLGASISYPSKNHPKATIATSGCGVCTSLMALMNLTTYKYSLQSWTNILIKNGCRDLEGTDMLKVAKLLEKSYGLKYTITCDVDKVVKAVQNGSGVIANVGARGYFSSGGHFVYVYEFKNNKFGVLDPYYYADKWTSTVNGINRAKHFIYNANNHTVYCTKAVLQADSVKYYIFTPTQNKKKATSTDKLPTFKQGSTYTTQYEMNVRVGPGKKYAYKKVSQITPNARIHVTDKNPNANAILKAGTKVTANKVVTDGNEIWLQIPSGYVCAYMNGKQYIK